MATSVFRCKWYFCLPARRDWEGGELVLVEQQPRAQSKAQVVVADCGQAIIFTTRDRPVKGSRVLPRQFASWGQSRASRHALHAGGHFPRREMTSGVVKRVSEKRDRIFVDQLAANLIIVPATEFADDGAYEGFGVAEEHERLVEIIERVFNSCETGAHTALITITVRALSTSRTGMPKSGLKRRCARRIGHVVRANHQGHVGLRKISVDIFHV